MYTIQQDSANKLVIPFNGTDYDFLLIVFTYSCYESVGIFENTAGAGCDYEIVVNEVGSDGVSDPENGDVKISPRSTWKGEVYGQDDNVNLFPQYAALIDNYKFQVKGDSCKVYPNLSPQIDCLPATAIVQDQEGKELARQDIASGATQIITVNVQTMINVLKGDFTGEFDLSVQDQNGFYNDYTEGSVINTLSLAASPKLGSIATVRILGGLLGVNAIPTAWDNFSSDAISQDNTQFNVLTILYVAADDVRIVNNVIAAPDFIAPEFTSAPTATNIAETSFDITAQLNENGTVYGYLLADGSPAPTVQEIIDNAQSQFTDSGSGGTLSFTGLTNQTNYDVYVVAEDVAGNKQTSPVLVDVLTSAPSLFIDWEQELRATDLGGGTIKINDLGSTNQFANGGYATLSINGDNKVFFKGDTQLARGDQGLGITNTYAGFVTDVFNMDIWVQLRNTGIIRVFEDGVSVQNTEPYVSTDEVSIEYNAGTVTVLKNGVVFYTSGKSYTLPLTPIALVANINIESKIREARFDNNTNLTTSPL